MNGSSSDVDANSETLDSDSQKPLIDDGSVSIVASIDQNDGLDTPDHRGNRCESCAQRGARVAKTMTPFHMRHRRFTFDGSKEARFLT